MESESEGQMVLAGVVAIILRLQIYGLEYMASTSDLKEP